MPEDVMKKYKQGELPADYSKDAPVVSIFASIALFAVGGNRFGFINVEVVFTCTFSALTLSLIHI